MSPFHPSRSGKPLTEIQNHSLQTEIRGKEREKVF